MMKTALASCVILTSFSVTAHEITSPFYLPEAGHFLTQTSATYTKNKINTHPTMRDYHRILHEEISIGLGHGIAALLDGHLNWRRHKQATTSRTTGYSAGFKAQGTFGDILSQLTTLYHQQTDTDFAPRRALEAHLHFGKTLQKMTPYLHLSGHFPIKARPDFNAPLYRGETGVFQSINTNMTLDSALYLQYDKNIKERSYGLRAEWSYLANDWVALSINGEWQARGKAHNTKTYHQAVGTKVRFSF